MSRAIRLVERKPKKNTQKKIIEKREKTQRIQRNKAPSRECRTNQFSKIVRVTVKIR